MEEARVSAEEVVIPPHTPGTPGPIPVQVEDPPDPRWHRFAMRVALGGSVTEAARAAGVSRSLGYIWMREPGVQRLVEQYAGEAANRARRELAGLVTQAVRTVRNLLKDASAKGAPTQLAAAQLVLTMTHLDLVPVAQTQQRVLTFVPRQDRLDQLADPAAHDLTPMQAVDLPAQADPQTGLPADFPRHADGTVDLPQVSGDPYARLTDPAFWQADPARRTMRRFGDGLGPTHTDRKTSD